MKRNNFEDILMIVKATTKQTHSKRLITLTTTDSFHQDKQKTYLFLHVPLHGPF